MSPGLRTRLARAAALLACGAAYAFLPAVLDRAAAPIAGVAAAIRGDFRESGDVPAARGRAPDGLRTDGGPRGGLPRGGGPFWSSWNGSNGAKGELRLGPFPAPRVLGLPVCGFPRVEGNRLYLENTATRERMEIAQENVGGEWSEMRLRLPPGWRGQPLILHAVDASAGLFGWLAVGSPSDVPGYAAWWDSFARKLHGFVGVGLVLLLLQGTAMSLIRGRPEIPAPLSPLASLALVALAGYGVFWGFCAGPAAGKALAWAILAASAARWVLRSPPLRHGPTAAPQPPLPILITGALGLAYFGLLALHGSDRSLSDMGAHRFIERLAFDNELPQMFADRLIHGEDSRHLLYNLWLSTDRPPLQTGCDLLLAYPVAAAGVSFDTAAQAAGIWLQLFWVSAAWGWLGILGFSERSAALVIAALAPAGFLVVNTVFVWPKLLSAALLVGAFSLWMDDGRQGPRRAAAWGSLAALSLLAYGGAAFSLIAWVPLVAWKACGRLSACAPAALAFAVLMVPWAAYQHLYNPPGDALIKLHLGGIDGGNTQGTWEAVSGAIRSQDAGARLHARVANVQTLFQGPWREGLLFEDAGDLASRREGEYFGLFFALGWWNLGFAGIAAIAITRGRGRAAAAGDSGVLLAVLWCLLTLAVWVLVMFRPGSTVVHQGSYACILLLFLCLAGTLQRAHRLAFGLVALASIAESARIWIPPNPARITPLQGDAAALAALAFFLVVAGIASASPEACPSTADR